MTSIKFIIEDELHEFDLSRIMSSEAIALEEDWGIQLVDFEQQVTGGSPSMRQLTALVWLMMVRSLATKKELPFLVAAKEMPAATFEVNIAAVKQPPEEPANPTSAGTRKPATRTTRATSAKPKPKRGAASGKPAT